MNLEQVLSSDTLRLETIMTTVDNQVIADGLSSQLKIGLYWLFGVEP